MTVLLFSGLGVVGIGLAARLADLQIYFVILSAVSLGMGYYTAYVKGWGKPWHRYVLWVSTAIVLVFWALPTAFPYLVR